MATGGVAAAVVLGFAVAGECAAEGPGGVVTHAGLGVPCAVPSGGLLLVVR